MAEPEVVVCYYEAYVYVSVLSSRLGVWYSPWSNIDNVPQDNKNRGSVSFTIGKRRRFCA